MPHFTEHSRKTPKRSVIKIRLPDETGVALYFCNILKMKHLGAKHFRSTLWHEQN